MSVYYAFIAQSVIRRTKVKGDRSSKRKQKESKADFDSGYGSRNNSIDSAESEDRNKVSDKDLIHSIRNLLLQYAHLTSFAQEQTQKLTLLLEPNGLWISTISIPFRGHGVPCNVCNTLCHHFLKES